MNTVLLTGLPRSGTTLACALLNRMPDVLALAEPLSMDGLLDRRTALQAVPRLIDSIRMRALEEGVAPTKAVGGWTSDNLMEPPRADGGPRRTTEVAKMLSVDKPLGPAFLLCVKHPALFTALADDLGRSFPVFALVRSPLAVLAAWQTIDFAPRAGRSIAAERMDPALSARLDRLSDPLDRQIELLSWYLSAFERFPEKQVIRYEDLILDPISQLCLIVWKPRPVFAAIAHEIRDQAPEDRYPGVDFAELARRLQRILPLIERFYPGYETILKKAIGGRRAPIRNRGVDRQGKPRIDFVVAGFQKAGTTAVASYLSEHPEIRMGNRKEVHFFDDDLKDWSSPDYERYHVWFRPPSSTAKAVGDATPIYTYWPNSLERLHAYNSKVRIVLLLRHPSLRAYSHWRMETVAHGVETLDFSAAIREPGRARVAEGPQGVHRAFSYVERGFYGAQIERVFELFPREQCWFARTDELWREPGKVLSDIDRFLGVEPLGLCGEAGYRSPEHGQAGARMTPADRAYLDALYRDDIIKTQVLTGLDLGDWLESDYEEPMTQTQATLAAGG